MDLGCMIIHHDSVTRLTKSFLIRTLFEEDELEIEVIDHATTVVFLWNVRKEKVWQATMDFESADLTAVYGFGKTKEEVFERAYEHLRPLLPVL